MSFISIRRTTGGARDNFVAIGQMDVTGKKEMRIVLSQENIDELFDAAGRKLAAGEGIHRSYWKKYNDHDKPNGAKLEIFAIVREQGSLDALEQMAIGEFNGLWERHKGDIQMLSAAEKSRFTALKQATGKPVQEVWTLPEEIVERKEGDPWESHLYCNDNHEFWAKLNSWEREMLEAAMKERGFFGWLRNLPRRDWAMCIPYDLGGTKAFFPDLVIVRKKGNGFDIDLISACVVMRLGDGKDAMTPPWKTLCVFHFPTARPRLLA
jgi:type III restriction enzyme